MRGFWLKLILFLVLWYEVAVELRLDGDRAFILSLAIVGVIWFGLRMSGPLVGMLGPTLHRLIVGTVIWLILFWWFAPDFVKAVPVVFVLVAAAAVMIAGGRARRWIEANRETLDKAWLRGHSEAVVCVVYGGLGLVAFTLNYWGSFWPLMAYVALPAMPFGFGWQLAGSLPPPRADAKFGSERSFHDAGLSEER